MKYLSLPVVLLALLSGGCKLVVEVPRGGAVATESGDFVCSEEDTCEVDIDDTGFDDTFVAVPEENYEFRGWKERSASLCSRPEERLLPCRLSVVEFAGLPAIVDVLLADIPVYLEPEFSPKATTTILFPPERSNALEDSIVVRGVSTDPDGVASIWVNGVPAALIDTSVPPGTPSQTFSEVSWQAAIDLQPGSNEIVVSVEDAIGTMTGAADSVVVDWLEVPIQFAVDEENERIIGRGEYNGRNWNLLAWDLNGNAQGLIADNLTSAGAYCYKADTGEYLHVDFRSSSEIDIRSLDVNTQANSRIASITAELNNGEYKSGLLLVELACASGDENAYLTYSLANTVTDSLTISRIAKVNLNSGESTVLAEFDTRKGDPAILGGVELLGDNLVAYPSFGWRAPLYLVNKTTGSKSPIATQSNLTVSNLLVDPDSGTIFVLNYDGIYRLDPGADRYRILSLSPLDDPLDFAQIREVQLDSRNNRILLSDDSLGMILAVSLSSGRRTELVARSQGEGVRMVVPRELYVTADKSTVYALDDGGNAEERLFTIDLQTGDREVIGDVRQEFNFLANGLTVDEEQEVAYVSFGRSILRVDLDSEDVLEIASDRAGFGTEISGVSGLVLDKANNRLLYADTGLSAVVELDLQTRVRSVFSQFGIRGAGGAFSTVNSLALDSSNNRLFASNQGNGTIMSIDMETGNRTVLLDNCRGAPIGPSQGLTDIAYEAGELVILDDGVKRYDVESGQCTVVSAFVGRPSLLGIRRLAADTYLAATFRGLVLFDAQTKQSVFISE